MTQTAPSQQAPATAQTALQCVEKLIPSVKDKELLDSIQTAKQSLTSSGLDDGESFHSSFSDGTYDGDWLFHACLHTCLHPTQPAKLRECALDQLQKLMAHKILRGGKRSNASHPSQSNASPDAAPSNISSANIAQPPMLNAVQSNSASTSFGVGAMLMAAWNFGRSPSIDASNGGHGNHLDVDVSSPRTLSNTDLPAKIEDNLQSTVSPKPATITIVTAGPPAKKKRQFLIDEIIHSVCVCFTSEEVQVQVQVLKVLLTAVTAASTVQVHGASLLKAVQTCFNIYMWSSGNGTAVSISGASGPGAGSVPPGSLAGAAGIGVSVTAKAALTQIVIAVFSRMERYASAVKAQQHGYKASAEGGSISENHSAVHTKADVLPGHSPKLEPGECNNNLEETPTSHEEGTNEGHTNRKPSIAESESHLESADNDSNNPSPYNPTIEYYDRLLRKDVFLVLRLLCRLSVHPEHNASQTTHAPSTAALSAADDVSPYSIRARSLALEMILCGLNNAGDVLQNDLIFSEIVKGGLATSVVKNSGAVDLTLFEFGLAVFLYCIRLFWDRMKVEVEVLLNTVYLHILEMGNSTSKQKLMVLEAILKICSDSQSLCDLYVNYDCQIGSVSLYERIVSVCAKLAQGKDSGQGGMVTNSAAGGILGFAGFDSGDSGRLLNERMKVKYKGVVCLAAIVDSLVDWAIGVPVPSDRLQEIPSSVQSPASQSMATAKGSVSPSGDAVTSPTVTAATFVEDALAMADRDAKPVVLTKNRLQSVNMSHQKYKDASFGSLGGTPLVVGDMCMSRTGSARSDAVASVSEDVERDAINAAAQRKALLKQGLKLFSEKPIKGVAFFTKHGFVPAVEVTNDLVAGSDDSYLEALAIARFLRNTPGLDKSAIGSYLGEGDPFCIRVMHLFVDLSDFQGLGFVSALRMFLQSFRLPGESQKIDRLMEKFADRYCENNPDVFAKADTAYTLAFSVIMLNTDLHSAHIKKRMDKPSFLKNNRGINDNADLPDDFLESIYDEIQGNEIIMEDEQSGKFAQMVQEWGGGELTEKNRMDLYRKEVAHLQKKSQQLLAVGVENQQSIVFKHASITDVARPMFATACWPLMAVFSQQFKACNDEATDDSGNSQKEPSIVDICLGGFGGSIRLASYFKLETEREAFVASLAKLTGLTHFRNFKPKSAKAIKTLLSLALALPDTMDASWVHIIRVVSQMERLHLLASSKNSIDTLRPTDEMLKANIDKFMAEFSSQETIVGVDKIFSCTTAMSGPAIVHFFRAVCEVSLDEVGIDPVSVTRLNANFHGISPIDQTGSPLPTPQSRTVDNNLTSSSKVVIIKSDAQPRMYLLQKIVEIAHYNMHRIRFEWSQIWRILQPHFVIVGCHPDSKVSSFAIDALRQLSMKFLEREELGHFSTQMEFLKSFERIMRLTTDDSIRHMILGSLGQMISARAGHIRSGWKSIFSVISRPSFQTTSSTDFDELLLASFHLLQSIFKEYFTIILNAASLMDFINCVADFALLVPIRQSHDEIILNSIQLLQLSATQMIQIAEDEIEHMKLKKDVAADPSGNKLSLHTSNLHGVSKFSQPHVVGGGLVSEEHFFIKWFPIFSAFSRIIMGSENLSIRTKCIECLFDVLQQCLPLFDSKCVRALYRSNILPIFDDLKEQFTKSEGSSNGEGSDSPAVKEGSSTIWILGLRLTVDLFSENFGQVGTDSETIASILQISHSMMQRRDQTLVATGQICLHQFLKQNAAKFSNFESWPIVSACIVEAFHMTNPFDLVNCDYSSMKNLPELPASMNMNLDALKPIPTNAQAVLESVIQEGEALGKSHGKAVSLESLDFNQTVLKCSVHIELVNSIKECLLSIMEDSGDPVISSIPPFERQQILSCFKESYVIARSFNANYHRRYSIWKKRLVQQLPNLIKQETLSVGAHVRLLFALYRLYGDPDECHDPVVAGFQSENVKNLICETIDIMERYVMMLSDAQVNASNINLWSPVVVLVLKELLAMSCWWKSSRSLNADRFDSPKCLELKKQLPKLFRLTIRMMSVDRADVRLSLQAFIERVGEELFLTMFL